VPQALLWPGGRRPVKTVPIAVNTVQHPLPSPARCYKLGQALGRAIAAYPPDQRIVVIATGGLSHQLDGERAGFINKEFDLLCLEKIVADPAALTSYSIRDLVRLAGTQGVELIMWLVMRGAMAARVRELHRHYHIPVSNTAAGVLLLENAA
jgi:protocatechuate 4,5-dioxygenase beta chain